MVEKAKGKKKLPFSVGSIVVVAVFALCIIFMFINIIVQRKHELMYIFGYAYSVVPSESMDPAIKKDDVVLIVNKDYDDIHADPDDGDIIIYYNPDLKIFIIHRAIGHHEDGSLLTKGDNNAQADTIHVTKELYRGTAKKWGECLGLGKLVNNGRNIIFAVVIFIVCFFFTTEIIGVVKSMIKKNDEDGKQNEVDIEKERERLRQEVMIELLEKENKS